MTDFAQAQWLNRPNAFQTSTEVVTMTTEPNTDFWQRSYYGFQNDNAPALLLESSANFSFTARAEFSYQCQFDQCGLIIYLDSNNWFKASIEFEDARFSRLGSVVTNHGYSDWATVDISTSDLLTAGSSTAGSSTTASSTAMEMWYRLSRRGPDFRIESSDDGVLFRQMRIFHLHELGETTAEMGSQNPPEAALRPIRFGLYACSPLDSSFEAKFDNFKLEDCIWMAH